MNPNIVFTSAGVAELIDRPMPDPKSGEVLVRVVRSCISSGTERANLIGVPDGGVGIFGTATTTTWPRQCGYSTSGVVEKLGKGVTGLKVGDRVAMSWTLHSAHVCVPAGNAYRIPDGVSFEQAALTHISTFPMAAIRKCRLEVGESALVMGQGVLGQLAVVLLKAAIRKCGLELGESAIVMGQGILGQLAVLILKAAGATPVIAADPVAEKRTRALALGADFALDPTAVDFAAQAKSLCPSEYRKIFGRVEMSGPKVGIEVTGVGAALNGVLDVIAPFGRIALLGCTRDSDFTVDYYHKVHGRGVTLVGAHTACRNSDESAPGWWTQRDDALAFLRLLALGRISLAGFVDEVHKISACGDVYARLARGGAFPVVQFDWT